MHIPDHQFNLANNLLHNTFVPFMLSIWKWKYTQQSMCMCTCQYYCNWCKNMLLIMQSLSITCNSYAEKSHLWNNLHNRIMPYYKGNVSASFSTPAASLEIFLCIIDFQALPFHLTVNCGDLTNVCSKFSWKQCLFGGISSIPGFHWLFNSSHTSVLQKFRIVPSSSSWAWHSPLSQLKEKWKHG